MELHLLLSCLLLATCLDKLETQLTSPELDTTNRTPACRLTAPADYHDQMSEFLSERAKLIDMTITMSGRPPDTLEHMLKDVYNPHLWVRSSSRQGRSLLVLDDNYRYKSLTTLSIGVVKLELNLTENPSACLNGLSQEEILLIFRRSFLTDFRDSPDDEKDTLGIEDQICNKLIVPDGDYANFLYRCCQEISDGSISCHDLQQDDWVKFLLVLIVIIKVLIILYSPRFLPDSLYRLKYVAGEYIHHLPDPPLSLKVAVTQTPHLLSEVNIHKTVRLSELKNMDHFKSIVSHWAPDAAYEVQVKEVRMSVKTRRLLDNTSVPVSAITLLYNNFIRCRIRRLQPLSECCASSVLGHLRKGLPGITWYKCMKVFARVLLVSLLAVPWIIETVLYHTFEVSLIESKTKAAEERGLKLTPPRSAILNLPSVNLSVVFLIVFIIFVIESVFYGAASKGMKHILKNIARHCLREMKRGSSMKFLAWIAHLTVMPFKVCGIFGLVLVIPYLVVIILISVPVVAFYIFPTVNLTVRLLTHLLMYMCPNSICQKFRVITEKLSFVKCRLSSSEMPARDISKFRRQRTTQGMVVQLIFSVMYLISFWCVTLLLMEVMSFFVEMAVFTFMGVVVNAGATLQYMAVLFLVLVYCKNTFQRVHKLYQSYHNIIHKQLMVMTRAEINEVAQREAIDQENSAFSLQGEVAVGRPPSVQPQIRIRNHKPEWLTYGMLVFLDKCDELLTPEKFFYETIDLNYFRCPGPIYKNVCAAVWEFLKIVLFLFFVFVVVMALGDVYKISTTNQLLATVVGGFIPFIFRYFFNSSTDLDHFDTSSVQFRMEFHKAINSFVQSWPVYDIVPVLQREWDTNTVPVLGENKPVRPRQMKYPLIGSSQDSSSDDEDDLPPSGKGVMEDYLDGVPDDSPAAPDQPIVSAASLPPDLDMIVDISNYEGSHQNSSVNKDVYDAAMPMLDTNKAVLNNNALVEVV